ncbi:MAG: tryptophan synthase subunit alpha [Planctomycetes bacterium]|nr:tryptophan synthase subunit alpha [Planctomycetota bacterium]
MLEVMEKANADIVELQFPFSEPTADGPLFVKANQAALDNGMTIEKCFDFMKEASKRFKMPFLMMGYYNTVYAMGEEAFCARLKDCGGVGFIVPDLPLEESDSLFSHAEKFNLSPVLIMTPNSSIERKQEIADKSRDFIYCVARKGVTGKKTSFDESLDEYLREVQGITDLPLALGFGVSTHEDLKYIKGKAHMAIIGSAALKAYESGGASELENLLCWQN